MNTNTLFQVCDEIFLPPDQLELPEFLSPVFDPSGSTVDHKGRVHHPYSPSKLNSLEACPRFRQGDSDNEASRRGTLQHEAFETGDDSLLTDEEVENVNRCREYVREIEALFRKPMRLQEQRLSVDDAETSAGFLDLLIYESDPEAPMYGFAVLIDFKFGARPIVEAENNLQAFAYFLGALRELPHLTKVAVRFLLPVQNVVESCDITVSPDGVHLVAVPEGSRAEHMLLRIMTVVERAKDPNAEPRANAGTCFYCSEKHRCKALHKMALRIPSKYEGLSLPEIINPSLVPMATPEDVSKGMKFFNILEAVAKAYKTEATKRATTQEDFDVPGFRIVSTERREVLSNEAFVKVAVEFGKLTPQEVLEASKISLTEIEKKVNDKAPRGQKKAAVEAFQAALEAAGATQKGSPVVYLRAE